MSPRKNKHYLPEFICTRPKRADGTFRPECIPTNVDYKADGVPRAARDDRSKSCGSSDGAGLRVGAITDYSQMSSEVLVEVNDLFAVIELNLREYRINGAGRKSAVVAELGAVLAHSRFSQDFDFDQSGVVVECQVTTDVVNIFKPATRTSSSLSKTSRCSPTS